MSGDTTPVAEMTDDGTEAHDGVEEGKTTTANKQMLNKPQDVETGGKCG